MEEAEEEEVRMAAAAVEGEDMTLMGVTTQETVEENDLRRAIKEAMLMVTVMQGIMMAVLAVEAAMMVMLVAEAAMMDTRSRNGLS